ncbi:MAG: type II toxin-antitoxin system VapC family toxin [Actinobacteria bacterium]|nr:type II toxin-antitoxin system VapC family toxin [Actinomycetota bacterium]
MIVLDTTILIDVLRGDSAARRVLGALAETPACSELTRVEVLRGVRPPELIATNTLLESLNWLPVTTSVAARAGDLGASFRKTHGALGVVELVIAATAIEASAKLLTLNVKRFPMFPGLRAPYKMSK